MEYQKETVVPVWSHNSLILDHTQLLPGKGKSLIVEQFFGMQISCIHHTAFELCMKEKRNKK